MPSYSIYDICFQTHIPAHKQQKHKTLNPRWHHNHGHMAEKQAAALDNR
jgi:hypothetical protein